MKKFLVQSAWFFGILISVFSSIEIGIFALKKHIVTENNLAQKYRQDVASCAWINELKSDSLCLLGGSSSVKYGLSCSILNELSGQKTRFASIAQDARDPIATYLILKKLNLTKIATVYFGLDPWIYTKRYYMHRNHFMYLDFNLAQAWRYTEKDNLVLKKRYINLLSLFRNNSDATPILEVPTDFGSVPLIRKPTNFNESVESFFEIDAYGWSDIQFEYLKKIQQLCANNGIQFVLFIPPKRSDYSHSYRTKCEDIHASFRSKMVEHKIDAPVFGRFDQFEAKFDTTYFAEAYHLNEIGQQVYSEVFFTISHEEKVPFSKNYSWFAP